MPVKLNPYLSFRSNARQALQFYHTVFGGKLDLSTFKEFQASESPDQDDLIMHGQLAGDNDILFMGADTPAGMEHKPGTTISMSLSGDDADLLRAYFDKLAVGGTVTQPLEEAPWGDTFGMLIDQFGIQWMVNIVAKK